MTNQNDDIPNRDDFVHMQIGKAGSKVTRANFMAFINDTAPQQDGTPAVKISSDALDLDADLTAFAALSGTGVVTHTGAGTFTERTLVGTADQIGVANPAGIAGNPTLSLLGNALALSGLTGAANKLPVFVGSEDMDVVDLTDQAISFLADPDAAYVNFTQTGTGAVVRDSSGRGKDYVNLLDYIPVNLHAGIKDGSNATVLTNYIQAAVDAANARWIGGNLGGGGIELFAPAGKYLHGAIIWKKGVCLRGEGKDHTIFLLTGTNLTGFASNANTATMVAADTIYWASFQGVAFFSAETAAATGQVLFDMVGFSRTTFTQCAWACGSGITSTRCTNAIPASSGGPASWHNDFYSCYWDKLLSTAGGTALLLGDTSATKETITTWNFYGGYIKNTTGTGLNLQSATGCNFSGVCFEGNTTAVLIGSVGARICQNVSFFGCYWEANTANWNIYALNTGTTIIGGFITSGTMTNNGLYTRISVQGAELSHVGPGASDYYQVYRNAGASTFPQVIGADAATVPGWTLKNSAGTKASWTNGSSASTGSQYHQFLKDDGTSLFSIGTVSASVTASTFKVAARDAVIVSTGAPGSSAADQGALWVRTNGAEGTSLYGKYGAADANWNTYAMTAAAQADFVGADLAALKVELNAFLAKLRVTRVLET